MINISTWLTFLRIFLAPCIMFAIYHYFWIVACTLFCLAAVTDFFDGYYARLYRQETDFGQLLDPVADKILLFSTLLALYQISGQSLIPSWFILLLIGKDLIVLCGAGFLLARKQYKIIAPSIVSKWVTALLMLFVMYLMLIHYGMACADYVDLLLLFFTGAMSIVLFDYIHKFFKQL